MAAQPCPICGNPAEFKRAADHGGWQIDCAPCGPYEITASAWPTMKAATAHDRSAALAWATAYNQGTRACWPGPALQMCVLTRLETYPPAPHVTVTRHPCNALLGLRGRGMAVFSCGAIMTRHETCPVHRPAAASRRLRRLGLEAVGAQRAGVRLQQRRQLRGVLRWQPDRRLVPIARSCAFQSNREFDAARS